MNKYKTVGLARMVLDGRHIQNFSYELEEAIIAAQLIAAGTAAKLYGGKREGRVLDLSRQLVRMRSDAYLFHVTSETAGPTSVIAAELNSLRPDAALVFWGLVEGANPKVIARLAATGTMVPTASIAEVLNFLIGTTPVPQALVSPYATGLLPTSEMARLGILGKQPPELFHTELTLLAQAKLGADVTIPVWATGCDGGELLNIATSLAASPTLARFELRATASALTENVLNSMPVEKIAQVIAIGASNDMTSRKLDSGLPVLMYGEAEKDQRAALYGANGNVALHAGFYFDAKHTPGIYHLELPLDMPAEQRKAAYAWATPSMDIRSAVVLHGSPADMATQRALHQAPLSLETDGWPKHTYAIERSASGAGHLGFDSNSSTGQEVNFVSLAALENMPDHGADSVTYVSIKTSQDADELERRLSAFHGAGEIIIKYPRTTQHIENSCRWMDYGACRLPLLRRVAVDKSNNLSSCRDAGTIGKVGDDYDQIVIRVKQQVQLEEISRECATCEVRDKCSHCAHLPDEWGGRYCSIKRSYRQVSLYLELHKFVQSFLRAVPKSEGPTIALTVSYTGLPAKYYQGKTGPTRDGQRPVLVRILEQDLVWWRGTQKIRRLSPPLAVMTEAWWSGADNADIVDSLMQNFSVDRDLATTSLLQGFEKLRTEGIING